MATVRDRGVTAAQPEDQSGFRGPDTQGLAPSTYALIDTIDRRGGEPRVASVANGLDGDTFRLLTWTPLFGAMPRPSSADFGSTHVGASR